MSMDSSLSGYLNVYLFASHIHYLFDIWCNLEKEAFSNVLDYFR
jgi:hypothetical protein